MNDDILIPEHVAIILDGNGRWAKEKKLNRTDGHKKGYENIEPIAIHAKERGIKYLSLYCFSTENWNRPKMEVDFLMNIPPLLLENIKRYEKNDIKVVVIGRKDRIPNETLKALKIVEEKTTNCEGMTLNICFDYGSLNDIKDAIIKIKELNIDITENTIYDYLSTHNMPKVDLLVRPGGEKRLSNFLLLESAYAELLFMDKYWPDFNSDDLDFAISEYSKRNRRFGGIKE